MKKFTFIDLFSMQKRTQELKISSLENGQNRSECVPVCKNSSVSFISFCCHVISQSDCMWHSH